MFRRRTRSFRSSGCAAGWAFPGPRITGGWTPGPPPTALRHLELTEQVKTMFDSSDGIFGHRMVHTKLAAAGIEVSVGTIAAIMAENGWAAKRMRAFKRTTIPSDPDKVFADLIGRDFTSEAPGTRLVGDITYLRTDEGWLYLATVIDLCTRMIVGWAMADHMRVSLTTSALKMARDRGYLQPDAIFHSDRGTQYTSREMGAWCRGNRVRQSMGETGVCWDTAVAESAFSSLKNEFTITTASPRGSQHGAALCATSRCSTTAGDPTPTTTDCRRPPRWPTSRPSTADSRPLPKPRKNQPTVSHP
ncbi:IS3 family transposase [Arthrobacter sp. RHLT1-20]